MPAFSIAPRDPAWISPLPSESPLPAIELPSKPRTKTIARRRQWPTSTLVAAAAATSSPINAAIQHPPGEVVGGVIVGSVTGFILIVVLLCCYRHRWGSSSSAGKRPRSSSLSPSPQPPPINHRPLAPAGPRQSQNPPPLAQNLPPPLVHHPHAPSAPPAPLPQPQPQPQSQPPQQILYRAVEPITAPPERARTFVANREGRGFLVIRKAKKPARPGAHRTEEDISSTSSRRRRRVSISYMNYDTHLMLILASNQAG